MTTWLNETSFPYGNGSHFRLRLYYDLSQNIAGNYSDVTFYLYFASVDGYSGSGASSNGYVNDNWVGSTTSVGRNAEVYLGSRADRYYHNNDGTGSAGYSASISCPWGIGTASLSGTLGLPTIPRQAIVTSATNFTDEENPTITFTNPAGFRMDAKLEFGGTQIVRSNIPNTGSYTFQLTDAERTLLRQKCTAKTMTVRETIATYIASSTANYFSWQDKTMTMINATPIKTRFDVIDTRSITVNLTDDNTKFIKYASNAKVNFNFSTLKYATLSVLRINGVALSNITPTSSDEGTTNYEVEYTINGINTNNVDIYIKDSRGIEYTDTKALDMIDYIPVSANVSAKRKQPTTGEIQTQFTGNYFNDSFGASNNQLTIMYKYKKVDEQGYSNYITLTENTDYTIENNTFFSGNYSSEYPIVLSPSFDYRYDYEIVIEFSDLLTSASKTLTVIKGIPIIQWNKTKFQVNGDLYIADSTGSNSRQITDLDIYSSDEIRIGTWVNGKPLYRKVFMTSAVISSTNDNKFSHYINNVDFIKIKEAFVYRPANGTCYLLPTIYYESNSAFDRIGVKADRTYVAFYVESSWNTDWEKYVVLEYTKTTDV